MFGKRFRGMACGIAAAVCYGMNPLGATALYAGGLTPDSALFYRYGFAALLLGVGVAASGEGFRLTRREVGVLASLGALFAVSSLTFFESFRVMDTGLACTILFVYPLMVAGVMTAFFGERLTWAMGTALALALGGNPVGSLLYAIAYSTVNVAVRAYLMSRGLNEGLGFIERLQRTGLIDRVTRASQMIAFAALGGLAAVLADGRGCLMGGPSDFLTGILACQDAVLPGLAGMVVCGAALVLLKRGARVETIMAASIVACLAIEGFVAFWA